MENYRLILAGVSPSPGSTHCDYRLDLDQYPSIITDLLQVTGAVMTFSTRLNLAVHQSSPLLPTRRTIDVNTHGVKHKKNR